MSKRPLPTSSSDPTSNPEFSSPKRQRSSPNSAAHSHSPIATPAVPSPSQPNSNNSRPTSSGSDSARNAKDATDTTGASARPIPADEILSRTEPPIPQKRAMALRDFLEKMDDYAPIIPDTLTSHYLLLAGLPPPPQTPLPLARLLALAVQKFIADLAADAYQHARIRSGHTTSNSATAAVAAAAGGASTQAGATSAGGVGAGAAGAAAGGAGGATGGGRAPNIGTQRPGFGGGGGGAGAAKQGVERTVLTMEDLGMAVGEYGVNVRRGEFYR